MVITRSHLSEAGVLLSYLVYSLVLHADDELLGASRLTFDQIFLFDLVCVPQSPLSQLTHRMQMQTCGDSVFKRKPFSVSACISLPFVTHEKELL